MYEESYTPNRGTLLSSKRRLHAYYVYMMFRDGVRAAAFGMARPRWGGPRRCAMRRGAGRARVRAMWVSEAGCAL